MASSAQIEANRKNALNSTGPKTELGKSVSSKNALKHGLLSDELLLPGEDLEKLEALREQLIADLNPVGELESMLVERIAGLTWRLMRVGKIEVGILSYQRLANLIDRAKAAAKRQVVTYLYSDPTVIAETVNDQEKYDAAVAERHKLEEEFAATPPTLGDTFVQDSRTDNALAKLSRYETSIDRALYRAISLLERVQVARYNQTAGY